MMLFVTIFMFYLLCFLFQKYIIYPLENFLFPSYLIDQASILFLPHFVRVISYFIIGFYSLIPIFLAQCFTFILLNNVNNNDDYLFLEVNFISIANNLTLYFDKLLESHQIKISRYMSCKYIKSYISEDSMELSMMANKLNNGFNKNEVQLISKNVENIGFFEKFFQLFS